ncbi:hypothetical protein QFC20_006764 [Naganishia adeliensis]|uniref:Uncharacterized protein n=1 Tax=Naganishia adeliensis TaxID=92952 RepID=A0ACC2V7N4_9TREE|nr:hypothetical protein QFC20_006764 [Naganishia adeliensis]
MSIRVPQKKDAQEMARILYEGLRTGLQYFSVVWPGAQEDNWISVQADYCTQHLEEPHSVAFVTTDKQGNMSGMAYGRFLDLNTVPSSSTVTMIGCDTDELDKMENRTFQKVLIEKHGGVLWIGMMSVLPEYQGEGLGRKLVEALTEEARNRHMNIALAGAPSEIMLYRKNRKFLSQTDCYDLILAHGLRHADAVGFYKKLGFRRGQPSRDARCWQSRRSEDEI